MDQNEFEQMLKDRGLALCCIHVEQGTRDAEFRKEDLAFVCKQCRVRLKKEGLKKMQDNLAIVHKSHLGI